MSILPAILLSLTFVALLAFAFQMVNSGAPDLRKPAENAGHKFGEAGTYYRGRVIGHDGTAHEALFTADQLSVAMERAQRNPEDVA